MMSLSETVELMNSADYKDRFKAEYWQLLIRYRKLQELLAKWETNRLDFIPTCPKKLLDRQASFMCALIEVLFERARIEGVDLND